MSSLKTTIETVQNMEEAEQAFSVSLKSFFPHGAPSEVAEQWRGKWFDDPSFDLTSIFVVKAENREIIGGIRTVRRILKRNNQEFKMYGLSEIFVDHSHQGQGLTTSLVWHVIQEGKRLGFEILAGVARRAIDHFYLKFGLFGLGSYSGILISGWSDNNIKSLEFSRSAYRPDDLDAIMTAYDHAYSHCFGPMKRDRRYWDFLLKNMVHQGMDVQIIKSDGETVGYFVANKERIIEIAMVPGFSYRSAVDLLWYEIWRFRDVKGLDLKVPNAHRLLDDDLQLDVTITARECYYGGHILKILNKRKVALLLEERLGNLFRERSYKSMVFDVENIQVCWDGDRVDISHPEDLELSYRETAYLLGASVIYGPRDDQGFSDRLTFALGELDEF